MCKPFTVIPFHYLNVWFEAQCLSIWTCSELSRIAADCIVSSLVYSKLCKHFLLPYKRIPVESSSSLRVEVCPCNIALIITRQASLLHLFLTSEFICRIFIIPFVGSRWKTHYHHLIYHKHVNLWIFSLRSTYIFAVEEWRFQDNLLSLKHSIYPKITLIMWMSEKYFRGLFTPYVLK